MKNIRKAEEADIPRLMEIFDIARRFMTENGNPTQWVKGYPGECLIKEEIAKGHCFVVCKDSDEIVGTFCFIVGEDPTYLVIKDGAWLNDKPYGTIHRLASRGSEKGVGKACIDWCAGKVSEIRADTHRDNIPMQNLLESNGFTKCGIIYTHNGTERIAYQRSEALGWRR